MKKVLFNLAVLLCCTTLTFAQTRTNDAKPEIHSQAVALKEGENIIRLDKNQGRLKIQVRNKKIVAVAKADAAGGWTPSELTTTDPGATFGCFPGLCLKNKECFKDGHCIYFCGDCGTPPPPKPGTPFDPSLLNTTLTWCTKNCELWE